MLQKHIVCQNIRVFSRQNRSVESSSTNISDSLRVTDEVKGQTCRTMDTRKTQRPRQVLYSGKGALSGGKGVDLKAVHACALMVCKLKQWLNISINWLTFIFPDRSRFNNQRPV